MIKSFQGEYRFLSNFHSVEVNFRGITFNSTEAAYQAAKSKDKRLDPIFAKLTPYEAKTLGRNIIVRGDWDLVKDDIMYQLNWKKYNDNPELKNLLLSTGDQIIQEGNYWGDAYWGVCLRSGEGQNKLGRILMKIRNELQHD